MSLEKEVILNHAVVNNQQKIEILKKPFQTIYENKILCFMHTSHHFLTGVLFA